MYDICMKKLSDNELDELKREVDDEIQCRASGPTRVIYQVMEWGDVRFFADYRCAALCFSDIAESVMDDATTEEGKSKFDINKGTLLYGIKTVEITLADFEVKAARNYFDDLCYEKRLPEAKGKEAKS